MRCNKYPDHPLRKLMDAQGYTVRSLAERCDLNKSTIDHIMARKFTNRQEYTYRILADTLGTSVEEMREICR